MKKIIILLLLLVFSKGTSFSQGKWYSLNSGLNSRIDDVFFIDSDYGWAVGVYGRIIRTTNGGTNWSVYSLTTTPDLFDVFFVDRNVGWAVGTAGRITHTTNGGTTWVEQTSGTTNGIFGAYFLNSSVGWGVGYWGTILYTTNGGANWTAQTSGTTNSLSGVYFVDSNTGWIVGQAGKILHTTNGGTNWNSQTSGTTQTLNGVYFTSPDTGWAVGLAGTILRTTNGGTNWSSQTSGTTQGLNDVSFVNSNDGWAVGVSGIVFHTTNGGNNWTIQNIGTTLDLSAVKLLDSNTGWIVGLDGIMFKYIPTVSVAISDTFATNHDTVDLPILLSNVDPVDSISSFLFKIVSDTNKVKILGYDSSGLLANKFTIESNTLKDSFVVAGAALYPNISSGTFMKLKCVLKPLFSVGDTAFIKFGKVTLNEGIPFADQRNGFIYYPAYYGDVSGDLRITAIDASLILQHVLGLISLSNASQVAADVSGNGQVRAFDASLILRYLVGIITTFPAGTSFAVHRDAYINSIASLLKESEDDEFIYYSLSLNNVKDVYSLTVALEISGLLCVNIQKSDVIKNFHIEHNVSNNILYIAAVGIESISIANKEKIIYLKCKKELSEKQNITLTSTIVNETEIAVAEDESKVVPLKYELNHNYPNPFNSTTFIKFSLPERSFIILKIYNTLGQEIRSLVNNEMPVGYYQFEWDGRNNDGQAVGSGVYIYHLQANRFKASNKMVLLR